MDWRWSPGYSFENIRAAVTTGSVTDELSRRDSENTDCMMIVTTNSADKFSIRTERQSTHCAVEKA
jgi:hypothetical protein